MSGEAKAIRQRPKVDPEIKAMSDLDRIMNALDPEAQPRVLKWLCDRYFHPEIAAAAIDANDPRR